MRSIRARLLFDNSITGKHQSGGGGGAKKLSGRTNPFARKRNAAKVKGRKTATACAACPYPSNFGRMVWVPTYAGTPGFQKKATRLREAECGL